MSPLLDKDLFFLQIYGWVPEFHERNKLPEDMPEDLKIHILKTNPKEVSEDVSL
jgi:hypothetical protein